MKQADYYRLGLNTIYDIMHAKMLRIRSLLETAEAQVDSEPNFESISDSAKDLINYASFFASYAEGKMDGQNPDNDIFNRPRPTKPVFESPVIEKSVNFLDKDSANYKGWAQIIKSDEITDSDHIKFVPIEPEEEKAYDNFEKTKGPW